jgi:hypothetical protein
MPGHLISFDEFNVVQRIRRVLRLGVRPRRRNKSCSVKIASEFLKMLERTGCHTGNDRSLLEEKKIEFVNIGTS